MGSADASDGGGVVVVVPSAAVHRNVTQPLVGRLRILPRTEFYAPGENIARPLRRKPPDLVSSATIPVVDLPTGLISQIRSAGNLKNRPVSRTLSTSTRTSASLPNNGHPWESARQVISSRSCATGARGGSAAAPNDLVNLLHRPEPPTQSTERPGCDHLSWLQVPLLPFQYIRDWIKHALWLSARVFPWKYGRVNPDKLLCSSTVQLAIDKACEQQQAVHQKALAIDPTEHGRLEPVRREDHTQRAYRILDKMSARVSDPILRIAALVVNKIFRSCLAGVYARQSQLAEIRVLSEARPGVPIIYLPLHRSHLDYILLTYVLWLHDMRLPQVAAGDNIALPLFNFLLRGLGAFFIRRRIDEGRRRTKNQTVERDYVYRGVLQEYMCEVLAMEHNMEFYMEGGRSRNGRTLPAKGGLLSVLIHAYQTGVVSDLILVPCATTFDKLVEGNFVAEQSGQPKMKETFGGAMRSIWHVMCAQFGSVRIEFGKPFLLKDFLEDQAPRFQLDALSKRARSSAEQLSQRTMSCASLVYSTPDDQRKISELTHCLATRILCSSTSVRALSGPNLVAFLMTTRFRSGCRESQLLTALTELCYQLTSERHPHTLAFDDFSPKNLAHVVRYTVWLFPHLFAIGADSAAAPGRSPTHGGSQSAVLRATPTAAAGHRAADDINNINTTDRHGPSAAATAAAATRTLHVNCSSCSSSSITSSSSHGGSTRRSEPPVISVADESQATAYELQYYAAPVSEALLGESLLATALLASRALASTVHHCHRRGRVSLPPLKAPLLWSSSSSSSSSSSLSSSSTSVSSADYNNDDDTDADTDGGKALLLFRRRSDNHLAAGVCNEARPFVREDEDHDENRIGGNHDPNVCELDRGFVEELVDELCDILRIEFIYLQDPHEAQMMVETAKEVLIDGALLTIDKDNATNLRLRCDTSSLQRLDNFRAAIAHLIEGYYSVAVFLRDCGTGGRCDRCLGPYVLANILAKSEKGLIEYPESCSKDIVTNAIKLLVRLRVLLCEDNSSVSTTTVLTATAAITTESDAATPGEGQTKADFYLGEQSSPNASANVASSARCSADKCLSQSAGLPVRRMQTTSAGLAILVRLIAKLERFRVPSECG